MAEAIQVVTRRQCGTHVLASPLVTGGEGGARGEGGGGGGIELAVVQWCTLGLQHVCIPPSFLLEEGKRKPRPSHMAPCSGMLVCTANGWVYLAGWTVCLQSTMSWSGHLVHLTCTVCVFVPV